MIQRFRVPFGFFIAATVLYLATPTKFSLAAGLPIAIFGAALRALAAGVIKKDSRLASSGPYAWTRNPLYLGSSLLAVGFAVMSWNSGAAGLLLIPSALIYPQVIRREESHLEQLFGDEFRAYRNQVPCFFPRFKGWGKLPFSFAQYLNNHEYNTAIGFVAAFVVFALKAS
jgi:protein-S-isoprenylcysteine O-methyltransferase Ste14